MTIQGYDYDNLKKKYRKQVILQSQNYIVKNGLVYDAENGEYIGDKYQPQWLIPVQQQMTIKSKEAYISKKVLKEHEEENGGFVFAFYTMSKHITDKYPNLKRSDIARLMYLGSLCEYETSILKCKKGKATESVTRKNFHNVVKLSRNRGNALLKLLINDGILSENVEKELVMNRELFYRGKVDDVSKRSNDINFTRMFRKTVENIFEAAANNEMNNVAILYMILPYLNFYTNIVSHNPSEAVSEKIKPMQLIELAEKLGYSDYKRLKSNLNAVKLDGVSVFGFFENDNDRRSLKIVVNPRVVFAGDGEELQAIKALFNQ